MININIDNLIGKYKSNLYTVKELAGMYNCSRVTINNKLKPHLRNYEKKKFNTKVKIHEIIEKDKLSVDTLQSELFDFMSGMLHGELRKIYWDFYKGNYVDNVTYTKLLKMSGPQRAKILRSDKRLREIYTKKTQRV